MGNAVISLNPHHAYSIMTAKLLESYANETIFFAFQRMILNLFFISIHIVQNKISPCANVLGISCELKVRKRLNKMIV